MGKTRTLVAIPVYNEEKHVTHVISQVLKYAKDILVVDDGSTDATPLLLARQPVEVVRHAVNRGYGQSLIDAFRWARCYNYDWLITMDCDEQHEPANLPDFHQAMRQPDVDVVSGSRYLQLTRQDDLPPADRQAINQTITQLLNHRLGLNLTDAFCGFKAYRVEALRKLRFSERGYAFPLQFWVQAAAAGLRVIELPIRLIYNDPKRSFGGQLDDPAHRLAHYRQVFETEVAKFGPRFLPVEEECCCQGAGSAEDCQASSAQAGCDVGID
ncbi:MAG: glycosyltransferase family 2 protein [Phycisphaeraceae bacterium]|nr:glycosyltransferase family 2 protein [Phycisphaeraceae bacterium]